MIELLLILWLCFEGIGNRLMWIINEDTENLISVKLKWTSI